MKTIVGILIGLCVLFLVFGCVGSMTESKNVSVDNAVQPTTGAADQVMTNAPDVTPMPTQPVYQNGVPVRQEIQTDVCDFDWTFQPTTYIGDYYTAPAGSSYVIVNVYLKNNGNKPISTNPYYWNFVANGIKYTADSATYDSSTRHQTVEVGKGGEIETQLVYLVNGVPTSATLEFNGLSGPDLLKVQHFTLENLLGPP